MKSGEERVKRSTYEIAGRKFYQEELRPVQQEQVAAVMSSPELAPLLMGGFPAPSEPTGESPLAGSSSPMISMMKSYASGVLRRLASVVLIEEGKSLKEKDSEELFEFLGCEATVSELDLIISDFFESGGARMISSIAGGYGIGSDDLEKAQSVLQGTTEPTTGGSD